MQTDVVIPARDEADTIGRILDVLVPHPMIGIITVMCDSCTDDTDIMSAVRGATNVVCGDFSGKGQAVKAGLTFVTSPRVMFCDADIIGLTAQHVTKLLADNGGMVIGVPDFPRNLETRRLWSWPWVSGQRVVPTALVNPLDLHGYLMEVQINQAARHANLPLRFETLRNVVSPYVMSERRLEDMQRDHDWGREHGVL